MTEQVALLRSLHVPGAPLVLANAWDVASARVAEEAGSPVVATTSAGVAWSLGAPDGDTLDRDLAVDAVRRVVAAVSVPVTADIESGFGEDPTGVAETVRRVVAAGAAGINLEDSVRPIPEYVARLTAARAAAPAEVLFINARIDTFLRGNGDVEETVARAEAYLAAGADGIFVPGAVDPAVVAALVERIPAPVNILVWPGAPTVAELAKLGVARVSLGSGVAEAAYAVMRRAVREALSSGSYDSIAESIAYGDLNGLLS
ncbi:2-methylisocitrate lyase-like PEP mutase family enzyme [Actinoplanes tereljensis]|uniref:isocitrate lyase/PEP mutase family protein n=1 Tax=Paractinoplanes tereljensis TaxID=571912 RepID=UPI001EF1B898|nr:isocitrate lyase/phosphoenolpyruvate mutase family protein [Actinoplanes tereljensis]